MTITMEAPTQPERATLHPGDRVLVLDAPSWCRRYLTGLTGHVIQVLPFDRGDVWVRFERAVTPWCERMDPVEEFPFSPQQLQAA